MRIFVIALLLVQASVVSRLVSGAAVDRRVNDRQQHTSVFKLLDTTGNQRRAEEELEHTSTTTVKYNQDVKEDEDEYYDYESDDEMSGDYMDEPRVAMSVKPQDKSSIFEAENTELNRKRGKGKKKGKGLGKKRNPCLKKYKNYCIHGTCQYLRNIRSPSCVCHLDYSGDRCQFFTLPVQSPGDYNRTTALAVVAVVLSSICLTIIGLLLMLRTASSRMLGGDWITSMQTHRLAFPPPVYEPWYLLAALDYNHQPDDITQNNEMGVSLILDLLEN